ncbi:92f86a0f-5903-4fca-ab4e-4565446c5867 [Thermothielavioides terrestris]|uniref:92f86a0f-5903-4fca-ab4e-4565446c5867 n=1 Tax=Thermothielavioides terrestris TaxID=2587410 RepID=A0A3S4C8K3_9PEZI|nr:92f86a0f-5903-4fca-ab4e-4565446c5867 [Thermothielavioides terrestris]
MADQRVLLELAGTVHRAVQEYAADSNISNYKALQTCVRRLQIAAATPEDTLFNFRLQVVQNMGIMMLVELGILDALVGSEAQTTTSSELAKASGCDEGVVGEQTYRANKLTSLLVQPGWRGAMRWMEIIYPVAADMRRFLTSTNFGRVLDPPVTAFEFVHKRSMWQVLENQPEQRTNFDLWMRERKRHEETLWHRRYPACTALSHDNLKSGPDAVLMVDVGGANGSQLINFKKQFPHLPGRYVLQDLPESLAAMRQPPDGIEVMAYDFFTPQPIKGARFYYFRAVFHNWPEQKCIEILRNLVPAMDPEYSTLLIDDYVLPNTGVQLHSAVADIHMMCMFNSSERTKKEYDTILEKAGLEIVAIYPAGVNEECVLEVRVSSSRGRPVLNGFKKAAPSREDE